MTTKTPKKKNVKEIHNELYLYHCAGGHTRAAMAQAELEKAGFRFERNEGDGPSHIIYWPDGVRLSYEGGNIVYRDWTAKKPTHTPGPLMVDNIKAESDDLPGLNYCIAEDDGVSTRLGYAFKKSDATLWAAAPDLLAACKAALAGDGYPSMLRAAIAKAGGA